jgi:hypothetical protein
MNYNDVEERKQFNTLMVVTWQSVGRIEPDRQTKLYWFNKLSKYPMGDVANAFDQFILSGAKQPPTIDDIIRLCRPKDDFVKAIGYIADEEIRQEGIKKIQTHIAEHTKKGRTDFHLWFKRILKNPTAYPTSSVKAAEEVARNFGYNLTELRGM